MLPQVNATLLSISKDSSTVEDWDSAASGLGPTIWSGRDDAYVQERLRIVFPEGAGDQVRQKIVTMYIPANLVDGSGDSLELETGYIVTYIYRGTTYSRKILTYSAPHLPGMNIVEYVKLNMQPEPEEATLEME